MNNVKQVIINDNGVDKTFILQKFKALEQVKFNHKLLSALDGLEIADLTSVANMKQAVAQVMQTGEKIEGADSQLSNTSELLPMLFKILRNALSGASDTKQDEIFSAVFNKVTFVNGGIPLQLNTFENDSCNVNNYVSDSVTIYLLVWEFIKFNYTEIYNRFFTKAE